MQKDVCGTRLSKRNEPVHFLEWDHGMGPRSAEQEYKPSTLNSNRFRRHVKVCLGFRVTGVGHLTEAEISMIWSLCSRALTVETDNVLKRGEGAGYWFPDHVPLILSRNEPTNLTLRCRLLCTAPPSSLRRRGNFGTLVLLRTWILRTTLPVGGSTLTGGVREVILRSTNRAR